MIKHDIGRVVLQKLLALSLRIKGHAIQNQMTHTLRLGNGHFCGNVGAGVGAVQIEAINTQVIECAQVSPGQVRHVDVGCLRGTGVAVAQGIECNDPTPLGKRWHQGLECFCRSGRRMNHHQRPRALGVFKASVAKMHLAFFNLCKTALDAPGELVR